MTTTERIAAYLRERREAPLPAIAAHIGLTEREARCWLDRIARPVERRRGWVWVLL